MKYSSSVFLIFILLGTLACEGGNSNDDSGSDADSDTDSDTDTDSDGDADNGDYDKADDANPLVVSGEFVNNCVPELSGEGAELYFLGYSGPEAESFVGFYWDLEDTETPDSFRVDVWIEEMDEGTPASQGTYAIPGPGNNFYDNAIQVFITTPNQRFVPVEGSGNITLVDYDINAPVGSRFSGYLQVELQEAVLDDSGGPTELVTDGCGGNLWISWYGTVIIDTK